MNTVEALKQIEAHEQNELNRIAGTCPADPPAAIEEPSEILITKTGFGGWWARRKYADGTVSEPRFRAYPLPRYVNQAARYAAFTAISEWHRKREQAWSEVRLLSGSARNYLRTNNLARILSKVNSNSQSLRAGYAVEIVSAAKKVGIEL